MGYKHFSKTSRSGRSDVIAESGRAGRWGGGTRGDQGISIRPLTILIVRMMMRLTPPIFVQYWGSARPLADLLILYLLKNKLRPFKINCVFWVTSLLPFSVSKWKTHTIYLMEKCCFSAYDDVKVIYEKFSTLKEKLCKIWKPIPFFCKNVCVFFIVCVFCLAHSCLLEKKTWLKTYNLFWMA